MKNLIQSMPRLAELVMDRCVTRSDHPRSDPEYSVTFNFSLLENQGKEDGVRAGKGNASSVQLLWSNVSGKDF